MAYASPTAAQQQEVDWEKLNKTKFLVIGAALFSGLTTCLYPLSVIKTRQMALEGAPPGLWGAAQVARQVVASDGVRGLYRGFTTVVIGVIPARGVYLTTLEAVKSAVAERTAAAGTGEAGTAGLANFVAGATASLVTQSVIVPVDVVSQRMMIAGGRTAGSSGRVSAMAAAPQLPPGTSGLAMARHIVRSDGVLGLYRGFGASIVTFVPSSALWWGSYGFYQRLIWQQVDRWREREASGAGAPLRQPNELMAVQTGAALAAGCTSATLTNPLDVIKTRLQTAERAAGGEAVTFRSVAKILLREEGARGLARGLLPRIANVAVWGTCMVSCYEFLKRICVLDDADARA